ncbi:tRNA 4-thiouridine(8) synthase ThiI [soil metagenome]
MNALVAHYHEVGLKGRNRRFFEDALTRNLKEALKGTGYTRARHAFGRFIVDFSGDARIEEAATRAARVFGVAYVGVGERAEPDMNDLKSAALRLIGQTTFSTFAVRARRAHSSFSGRSQSINTEIGQALRDASGAAVDLRNPDTTFWIELFGGEGIAYRRRLAGPGGLPVGVSGKLMALLSGGIDSPVAAWLMGRRGACIELVHFHGLPYTDPSSVRQATELAGALAAYHLEIALHLVPLAEAQREIVTHAPSSLRTLLYRRMMLRIAAALGEERHAQGLVTGDSLGQVASQTIENIRAVDAAVPAAQVLRPLIGLDKLAIIEHAKQIGTFEISTRSYEDCCVLFQPRSPATRANAELCARAERDFDAEAAVGKALAGTETVVKKLPSVR